MSTTAYIATIFSLASNPALADEMSKFRHRLFVKELGWTLPSIGDRESDEFDTMYATYCCVTWNGQIVAGFRAIQCDRDYLAQTHFPYMAERREYPRTADYVEISRLGASRAHRAAGALIYSLMVRYGIGRGYRALVALADLKHERHLNRRGLSTTRYGTSEIVGYREDGSWIVAVAGEIGLDRAAALQNLINLTSWMEIFDETHVLRRECISNRSTRTVQAA